MPRMRLTYGTLPPKSVIIQAFEAECPEGHFSFGNDKRVGNCSLSCEELWREVVKARNEPNDAALQWCSDVLGVLGIEWV